MRIKKTFQTTVPTGKVLNNYTESNVDTYSCDYTNSKTLKLLWENSNPSSTFASQDINLSSSDYDYLRIFYKGIYNQTSLLSIDTLKGFGFTLNFAGSAHVSGSGNYYGSSIWRECTRTNDTKFNVPVCTVILGNNTTGGADNTAYCVPVAIYGGKF